MKYYTTAEAAEILHTSRDTVSKNCANGTIPAAKPGNAWLISEAALEALLEPTNAPQPEPEYETAAEKRRTLSRSA